MRLILLCLGSLCGTGSGYIPSLSSVAASTALVDGSTDLNLFWNTWEGDRLIASAIATRDFEQIQASALLSGKLLSLGMELREVSDKIGALCAIMLGNDMVHKFFSESVFQEKKEKLLELKRTSISHIRLKQQAAVLFPFVNLHYVCGRDLPLAVKAGIFKSRVASTVVTSLNNVDRYEIMDSGADSLDDLIAQLLRINSWPGTDEGEFALLFRVRCGEQLCTTQWLSRVMQRMFPSDYLRLQPNGAYVLDSKSGVSVRHIYIAIGQLFALALMHDVAIPATLDQELLHALLLESSFGETPTLSMNLHYLRAGFLSVTSHRAVFGGDLNPSKLLNETELSDVLRKNF